MSVAPVALITGFVGALARQVGAELHRRGYRIIGVDYRPVTDLRLDYDAQLYQANYNKTHIEDVFRRHEPTHVLHLGRVGNLKERMGKRFDLNVVGSRKLMDLSAKYGARRLVVLSTFHIYGAHPHNHIPIFEDEPLRAGTDFPQIADAIQLDSQALLWSYRNPDVKTALLRPTNVIGPEIQNAMSSFLRSKVVPVPLGFDPMVQFIHQQDLVECLVTVCESDQSGVFNVAGPGVVPWRTALSYTPARQFPVPTSVAFTYLRLAGLFAPTFPPYLVNFFKYPCVISDAALRQTFGWEPKIEPAEAVRSCLV